MRIFFLCWLFLIQWDTTVTHPSNLFLSPVKYKREAYKTIEQSFKPPDGFTRVTVKPNSFQAYLRNLPVVTDSFNVLDFRDHIWKNSADSTIAGVLPVDISGKRLWQCMDILIRLHVDYLEKKDNQLINYPLPDGTTLSWGEWQNGFRPVFKGLSFQKILTSKADSSQRNFIRYLNTIYEYSWTQSFWHYYPDVKLKDIQPADFIVKKGKNGHAVLIVDIVRNQQGEKMALIGQGDTPACQFYLLRHKNSSPWFKIDMQSAYPDLPIKKHMFWQGLRRFPE